MKILYLDPVLGISGDMTISALIDAGCPFSVLTDLLGQLPVEAALHRYREEAQGRDRRDATFCIGQSDIHLSVAEMREMIEGVRPRSG